MTEKAFRLDFLIAIAALLVSAVSALALLYQTRVVADQYAATIWPYVSSNGRLGPRGLSIGIVNDGLGPALIQSAQLIVDGKPVPGWNAYLGVLLKEPQVRAFFVQERADLLAGKPAGGSIMADSLGPGTTIRPGDSLMLWNFDFANAPALAISHHTVGIKLCYCSLNKSCWTLDTTGTKNPNATRSVSACTSNTSIAPMTFMSLSVRPRKKSP